MPNKENPKEEQRKDKGGKEVVRDPKRESERKAAPGTGQQRKPEEPAPRKGPQRDV
jgi:hypothetical protein